MVKKFDISSGNNTCPRLDMVLTRLLMLQDRISSCVAYGDGSEMSSDMNKVNTFILSVQDSRLKYPSLYTLDESDLRFMNELWIKYKGK